MSPETWAGLAAVAGAFGGGLAKHAWAARKNGNGNGNGHRRGDSGVIQLGLSEQRLGKVEAALFEPEGYVRKRFHDLANALQEPVGRISLLGAQLAAIETRSTRLEGKVDSIGTQITEMRVEMAERGNHCTHCDEER